MEDDEKIKNTEETEPAKQSWRALLYEIIYFVVLVLLIVVPIRVFIAQPYIVNGSSMEPTFQNGNYLIVDQLSYRLGEPERGDVIIFRFPLDTSKFFIKRIIGLPGETVTLVGGDVSISSEEDPEGFILPEPYLVAKGNSNGSLTLSSDEYFVMGDNRGASLDSRSWGAMNEEFLIGKTFLRLFPLNRIDYLPGEIEDDEENE